MLAEVDPLLQKHYYKNMIDVTTLVSMISGSLTCIEPVCGNVISVQSLVFSQKSMISWA